MTAPKPKRAPKPKAKAVKAWAIMEWDGMSPEWDAIDDRLHLYTFEKTAQRIAQDIGRTVIPVEIRPARNVRKGRGK
jgi:hypothetical protein